MDSVNALAIQPDGKLIVGGFARKGFHRPLALARYNADGTTTDSSATFAFKIKRGAPRGDYPFTFRAEDAAGRERAVTVTLTVN